MAEQDRELTDSELLAAFGNPKADLALLSPSEQTRLVKLTETPSSAAQPSTPSNLSRLVAMLPTTDTLVNAIPAAAGAAGGVIGGIGGTVAGMGVGGFPGAVGGAALGGGAGEALKQLLNSLRGAAVPASRMEAAKEIGKAGATQGAMEVAGAGLGAGAKVVGKALMENAVRPTQTLLRDFPNVIDTLVSEHLPVGRFLPGMAKGSVQAAEKLGAAAKSVKALLAKAGASGSTIDANAVANPVLQLVDDLAKQPIGDAQEKQLANMLDEFMRRHPGPLTPLAVKELKQQAQAIAKPIYSAVAKGFPVTADQTLSARFNGAIASGAKDSLEKLPGVGAAVGAGEKSTQDMIGAVRALKQAETRRLSLMAEGASAALGSGLGEAVGGLLGDKSPLDSGFKKSIVGWAVTRSLLSPRVMSREGIVLSSETAKQILRQFPRLAESLMTTSGQGTTGPQGQ